MNPWNAVVNRFGNKHERFAACVEFSAGRVGSRANRGRELAREKIGPVIDRSGLAVLGLEEHALYSRF